MQYLGEFALFTGCQLWSDENGYYAILDNKIIAVSQCRMVLGCLVSEYYTTNNLN